MKGPDLTMGDQDAARSNWEASSAVRLTINHSTSYQYARAITLQPHRLVVTPRDSGYLTTITRQLRFDPEATVEWRVDVFGNQIAIATFEGPTDQLTITSEAVVDTSAPEWPIFIIDLGAQVYPFTYSLDEVVDLGALAQPDWLSPGAQAVGEWARRFVLGLQTDTLSLLKDVNTGILNDVAYRVRDEEGTQLPAETLQLRSGSCRDIAGLFIEAVRHLGFGSRAVSGYLFDPDQKESDLGSTHAWAEVYLPGAGWITFDPTNRRMGAAQLVPVGFARLNRQIMPLTGSFIGAAEDFRSMQVNVSVRLCKEAPEPV